MATKAELVALLQEQGYGCVVKPDRRAHLTDSACWAASDWLIPLRDMEEAQAHGYEPCRRCRKEGEREA